MLPHDIITLLASAVLISIAGGTPTTTAKMVSLKHPAIDVARSFAAAEHNAPAERTVRVDNPEGKDEERDVTNKVAELVKLKAFSGLGRTSWLCSTENQTSKQRRSRC